MKNCIPVCITVAFLLSCTAGEREYQSISSSHLQGQELLETLKEFELRHPHHFSSKVDLGSYYFLENSHDLAKQYFQRAEIAAKHAPPGEKGIEHTGILHSSLARIFLEEGNIDKALSHVEKAINIKSSHSESYHFLKAHILLASGKHPEALAIFDEKAASLPHEMEYTDIRAYMYLLADAGRFKDCARELERYFEQGPYFPGLGLFASSVYEAEEDFEKSVYAAFLEYEYYAAYNGPDDTHFLSNLARLENLFPADAALRDTAQLVRSQYDPSIKYPDYPDGDNPFFPVTYIIAKNRLRDKTFGAGDFSKLIEMERYFNTFPVYYWLVWQAVSLIDPSARNAFVQSLEKIIALNKEGFYAKAAWDEIGSVMGFKNHGKE